MEKSEKFHVKCLLLDSEPSQDVVHFAGRIDEGLHIVQDVRRKLLSQLQKRW